jgi:nucleotide-binding universal stress UspA family protein
MKTINRILLLTDFSDVAKHATSYTKLIAGKVKAEVDILHIINTPVDWSKLPLDKEKLYPEVKAEIGMSRAKLSEMVMDFSKQDIHAVESLVFNLGVENIPQHIENDKYDLIIMGSHGTKGINPFSIGSNAQSVIRKARIPVLVVKKAPDENTIKRIVMATTFDEDQRAYYKQMMNYASDLKADVDLLYINTPYNFRETEEIENMHAFFCEGYPVKSCKKHHVDAYNEERGILYFMENTDADIFAIAKMDKSKLTGLFSPSLSEAVVSHLDSAVLVFHI